MQNMRSVTALYLKPALVYAKLCGNFPVVVQNNGTLAVGRLVRKYLITIISHYSNFALSQISWLSKMLLVMLLCDNVIGMLKSYKLIFIHSDIKTIKRVAEILHTTVHTLQIIGITTNFITMTKRAKLNIGIIQNLDQSFEIIGKNRLPSKKSFAYIQFLTLQCALVPFVTSYATLPIFINRYGRGWQPLVKTIIIFTRYSVVFSLNLLFLVFGYSTVYQLSALSKALSERTRNEKEVEKFRFALWKLEQVVQDMNKSFWPTILFTLVSTNANFNEDMYKFLREVIDFIVLGKDMSEGVSVGIWTLLDVYNILPLLYPAIILRMKVTCFYRADKPSF
jgi:hypothetical protein